MKQIIFIVLTVLPIIGKSQVSDFDTLIKKITNGTSKQWVLEDTRIFLGEKCANGIILTFTYDPPIVTEKICEKDEWQTTFYSWQLTQTQDEVIPILNLLDKNGVVKKKYKIQIVKKNENVFLRLRKSTIQFEVTEDLYFK